MIIRTLVANATKTLNATGGAGEESEKGGMTWYSLVIVIFLVLLSAYSNGVNIGVMGLDVQQLQLMSKGPYETEEEAKEGEMAKKLLPLRSKGL